MRYCLSCKDPIEESRRKDARYCKKPGCRAKDFRRRKRAQAVEHPEGQARKPNNSVVVTCSCGNRLLVEVTHLGREEAHDQEHAPPAATSPAAVTPRTAAPPLELLRESTPETTLPVLVGKDPPAQESPAAIQAESIAVTRTVPGDANAEATDSQSPTLAPPDPAQSVAPNGSPPLESALDVTEAVTQSNSPSSQPEARAVTRTVSDFVSAVPPAPGPPTESRPPAAERVHPSAPNGSLSDELATPRTAPKETTHRSPTPAASPPIASQGAPPLLEAETPPRARASLVKKTCELAGSVRGRRLVPLSSAVERNSGGRLGLLPGVELYLCCTPTEGQGISGSPGCWRELYPDNSPADFGQDADLAVVGWDAQAGRAYVLPVDLLRQLLGNDWRGKIRDAASRWG